MTTKPSIGKRLLGVMLAVPMALAGMGIGATTAVAADTVPTNNLIAAYDFTTKPSDGKTVANSAPNATLGAAEVQNSADSLWADDALTLSGGAKTGTGVSSACTLSPASTWFRSAATRGRSSVLH